MRGGATGVRALLKQARGVPKKGSLAKAAERFLRRQVEWEGATPFDHTPAARTEHAARLSGAQVALRLAARPALDKLLPDLANKRCSDYLRSTPKIELGRSSGPLGCNFRLRSCDGWRCRHAVGMPLIRLQPNLASIL